ncbi:hypothetical protein M3Y99_00234900 [Aphelenchoides fujianensis]|nr:hypothetical protein M3Y99_00234900 [Aphelenchoides fujianensis]
MGEKITVLFELRNGEKLELSAEFVRCSAHVFGVLRAAVAGRQASGRPLDGLEIELRGVPPVLQVDRAEFAAIDRLLAHVHARRPADVVRHATNLQFWMETVGKHKAEILLLFAHVDKNVLIRAANLADFLVMPLVVAHLALVLADRVAGRDLEQLRAFLNEPADHDERERALIDEFRQTIGL